VNLENLKQQLKNEIERLEQRQAGLRERMAHMQALETSVGTATSSETPPAQEPAEDSDLSQTITEDEDQMLAGLRCLKCGASLRRLIPLDSSGKPFINSPRLGKFEGGSRHIECPQCLAKNVFVRTAGPLGWRMLVTQLK
jgi:hypothetical protein